VVVQWGGLRALGRVHLGWSLGEAVMCCSAQCQLFVCKHAFRLGLAGLTRAVGWLGFDFGSRL
jgi:hypothetical protein